MNFYARMNVLAVILIIAYQISNDSAAQTEDIIRPIADQREYKNILLSNGMNVLLISDPQTTSSAASVSVQIGSFADPSSMKGLAHFIEHLLFLGSDKYPDLSGFAMFVLNHGGSENAYTQPEETNFYFQISKSSFESALDRFLHMFVDPIFTEEWANNAAAAVNSEYNIDLQKDDWKFYFALQLAANPKSPFSKFSIGNTQTLIEEPENEGLDIIDTIKNFFNSQYSSNLMSLVVLHNETIDTIQSFVKQEFSLIDNKQTQKPSYSQFPKPFSDDYTNNLIQILPVGTDRIAYLIFCVDSVEPYPVDNPLNYIYDLLSYGGQGGLSSIFKKKGWIVEFYAGAQARQSSFELVRVSLTLTEDGIYNLTEMVRMTLAYLDLISKQGLTQALFDQFAKTSKYIFDYYQYEDNGHDIMSEVKTISSNMDTYPIKYVLAGNDVLYHFNSDLTSHFLSQINVENLVILVGDPSFDTVEPSNHTTSDSLLQFSQLNRYDDTYHLNYTIDKFSDNFINNISQVSYTIYPQLKLPVQNPYIPINFAIVGSNCIGAACIQQFASDRNNKVKQIVNNSHTIVRYLTERSFGAPFTTCYIKFNTASLQSNVKYMATSGIIAQLVNLVHTEELYEIRAAGHSVDLEIRTIQVEAFSEKFPMVLQVILEQYRQTNYTKALFENARDNFASNINQNLLTASYLLAYDIQSQLLLGRSYTSLDIQQAASNLSFADFKTILQDMQTSAQIETFLYGNLLENQAKAYGTQIVTLLGYQAYNTSKLITESVVNITGKNFVYRGQTPTLKGNLSVTLNYYQGGVVNIKDLANLKILAEILQPEAKSYLRSQHKLGYTVTLTDDRTRNVIGLKVLVVSSSFTPNQVDLEIESFWQVAVEALNALTDDVIQSVIESYKEDQVYDTKSYRIKANDLYSHISNEDYMFDMRQRIVDYLPNVTKVDMLALFNAIVKQPKKISIQLYSQDQETIESDLLPATSEYSNTAPTLIQGQQDLSSLPRFASLTVLSP